MATFKEVFHQYRDSMQTDAVWNKLYSTLQEFVEREQTGDAVIFTSDGSPVTGLIMKKVLEEIRVVRIEISRKMSEYDNTQIGKVEKKDGKSEGTKNAASTRGPTGDNGQARPRTGIRKVTSIRRPRNPDAQKGDG